MALSFESMLKADFEIFLWAERQFKQIICIWYEMKWTTQNRWMECKRHQKNMCGCVFTANCQSKLELKVSKICLLLILKWTTISIRFFERFHWYFGAVIGELAKRERYLYLTIVAVIFMWFFPEICYGQLEHLCWKLFLS